MAETSNTCRITASEEKIRLLWIATTKCYKGKRGAKPKAKETVNMDSVADAEPRPSNIRTDSPGQASQPSACERAMFDMVQTLADKVEKVSEIGLPNNKMSRKRAHEMSDSFNDNNDDIDVGDDRYWKDLCDSESNGMDNIQNLIRPWKR